MADVYALTEASARELKRELQLTRASYDNLSRRLASFNVRRHEGTYKTGQDNDTVQVFHEGGRAGEIVEANASNVHPGRIKRFADETMATYDDIWVGFTDNYDVWGGDVLAVQEEYYGPGRKNGTLDVGGDERPLYLVTHGERHWEAFACEEIAAGTATEVEFLEWSVGDSKFMPTGLRWDAQDFFLNTGETAEEGTKLQVKWRGPRLIITNMYCTVSDDEDIEAARLYSPVRILAFAGEYEPFMPFEQPFVSVGGSYGEAYNSPMFEMP